MQKTSDFLAWLRKHGSFVGLLTFLCLTALPMEAAAMELSQTNGTREKIGRTANYKQRTNFTQEEFDEYTIAIVTFIRKKKGWNPGEYRVRLSFAFADAPLVVFNVIHYDGVRDLKENPPKGFGIHPLELQVFIQTDEMRAFDDNKEYHRVIDEYIKED